MRNWRRWTYKFTGAFSFLQFFCNLVTLGKNTDIQWLVCSTNMVSSLKPKTLSMHSHFWGGFENWKQTELKEKKPNRIWQIEIRLFGFALLNQSPKNRIKRKNWIWQTEVNRNMFFDFNDSETDPNRTEPKFKTVSFYLTPSDLGYTTSFTRYRQFLHQSSRVSLADPCEFLRPWNRTRSSQPSRIFHSDSQSSESLAIREFPFWITGEYPSWITPSPSPPRLTARCLLFVGQW